MGLDYVTISLLFHSSYKYKIAIFRSLIIERIVWKVQLYGLKTVYVELNGATSSREHTEAMKKLRLDKNTANTYLIVLRALSIYKI